MMLWIYAITMASIIGAVAWWLSDKIYFGEEERRKINAEIKDLRARALRGEQERNSLSSYISGKEKEAEAERERQLSDASSYRLQVATNIDQLAGCLEIERKTLEDLYRHIDGLQRIADGHSRAIARIAGLPEPAELDQGEGG